MHFNFYISSGYPKQALATADDTLEYLRESISLCGYTSQLSYLSLRRDAINILFEPFEYSEEVDWLFSTQNQGIRFGVLVSELYVNDTLPYLENGLALMSLNSEELHERFRRRQSLLNRVVSEVDFSWSLLERSSENFKIINPNSFFYPFGHTKTVPANLRAGKKDIDVLFIGKATPYRLSVLGKLANAGLSVFAYGADFPNGHLPNVLLNTTLDRSKIGLSLTLNGPRPTKDGKDERFASCTRIQQMLGRQMCVVSEEIPWDNPYRDYMCNATVENLAETCKNLLSGDDWQRSGVEKSNAFQTEMDASVVCKPILEKSIEIYRRLSGQ
jgi:hypothetical protein